jgi:hypothetical protein
VGYKDPGGFEEPALVGDLKNVGCESCHGRGDHHGQDGVFNTAPRDPKTCTQCHTSERDTTWDEAKIETIACPSLEVAGVGQELPAGYMKTKKPPGRKSLEDPDHVRQMIEAEGAGAQSHDSPKDSQERGHEGHGHEGHGHEGHDH